MKRLIAEEQEEEKTEELSQKDKQELLNASAKILEVRKNAIDLMDVYKTLFEHLNELYNQYPNLYQEIQRVVELPTNDDAQNVVNFYQDLLQELEILKNSDNLQLVMHGNSLDIPLSDDEEE